MSEIPSGRRYSASHEWALKADGLVAVGITRHAVESLGDLVFVDLPEVGEAIHAGQPFGEIESVKAVSELLAPVTGKIVEVNEDVEQSLETISESPYEDGWLIKIDPTDPGEYKDLLSSEEYAKRLEEDE